jgi:hypothetical protein
LALAAPDLGATLSPQLDSSYQFAFSLVTNPNSSLEPLRGPQFSGQELELLSISNAPGPKVALYLVVKGAKDEVKKLVFQDLVPGAMITVGKGGSTTPR